MLKEYATHHKSSHDQLKKNEPEQIIISLGTNAYNKSRLRPQSYSQEAVEVAVPVK